MLWFPVDIYSTTATNQMNWKGVFGAPVAVNVCFCYTGHNRKESMYRATSCSFYPVHPLLSLSDGTIVATRLTYCPYPAIVLWVALSIYFHFIKLTQLGVSANTTSVMATNWAPQLKRLTKHHLISALALRAHPVCTLSLLRTRPTLQSSRLL